MALHDTHCFLDRVEAMDSIKHASAWDGHLTNSNIPNTPQRRFSISILITQMAYMAPNQTIVNSGGAGSPVHYVWNTNPPPHPSTLQAEMPQFFILGDQNVAKRVPRPPKFTRTKETFDGITFSTNGWPGVRVRDLLRGTVTIDHSTDTIFTKHGWRETTLALEWPGYKPGSSDASRRRIKTIHRGTDAPITRRDFAIEIADMISELSRCARDKPVEHGCEDWAFSQNKVHLSDVYILSAHYYRNVWVPELYVINQT